MEKLLEYLKKQRNERVKKLDAYNEAFAEFEAAKKRVDAFGDMGGIEGEIGELDTYICEVDAKMGVIVTTGVIGHTEAEEAVAETNTTVGDQEAEGVVDEIVVTCTKE